MTTATQPTLTTNLRTVQCPACGYHYYADNCRAENPCTRCSILPVAPQTTDVIAPDQEPAPQSTPAGGRQDCPLGCGRVIPNEGGFVHYCVTKITYGRRVETTREYVGTFDGEAVIYGNAYYDVEARLSTYVAELRSEGWDRTATELDGGYACSCLSEASTGPRGPYALTCEGCGKAKREANFSRLEATDPVVLCDDCQAAAGARIKAAVLAQIAAEEPLAEPATPDQLHAEPPVPATAPVAIPPLSINACCLCDSALTYPGAPCPRCGCGPCLFCGGAHLFVRCPRVIAEQARLDRLERAGSGVDWHLEKNRAQFLLSLTHCGPSDRQALAGAYAAARGGTPELVLSTWLSWIEKAAA